MTATKAKQKKPAKPAKPAKPTKPTKAAKAAMAAKKKDVAKSADPHDAALRAQLRKLLDWEDAHVSLDSAIAKLPPKLRGVQPEGLPYSIWQLVEHLRIVQFDILDFCVNAGYEERAFPDDYWPKTSEPPSAKAWDKSVADLRRDREALAALAGRSRRSICSRKSRTDRARRICASSSSWPITPPITSAKSSRSGGCSAPGLPDPADGCPRLRSRPPPSASAPGPIARLVPETGRAESANLSARPVGRSGEGTADRIGPQCERFDYS